MAEKFHSIVIGAGPGGYVAALRLAAAGQSVALIEKDQLGGTCLNRGCIPTKALLHSSEILGQLAHADLFGIKADNVKPDLPAMIKRKNDVVQKLRAGITHLLKARKIKTFTGAARLTDPHSVQVTLNDHSAADLSADHLIIATGSLPTVPAIFPKDRSKVMTSTEILDLTDLPASLLIVGGGYIGCEFATMFSELGAKVTVVEMLDRLLPMSDPDISRTLAKIFKANGIDVLTATPVEKMELHNNSVHTTLKGGRTLDSTLALICTGRAPNTAGLDADKIGLKIEKGFLTIDSHCRTNLPHIYAIGDVTGKLQLAHVASRQANVAAANILGAPATEDYSVVPAAVYTHPEIASVGLTEDQAKQKGIAVKTATFPMAASGIALAYHATTGFAKLLADADGILLGAHLMCPHASDLIHEIAALLKSEATLDELHNTIHAHPTFAEALAEAADSLLGHPLHST